MEAVTTGAPAVIGVKAATMEAIGMAARKDLKVLRVALAHQANRVHLEHLVRRENQDMAVLPVQEGAGLLTALQVTDQQLTVRQLMDHRTDLMGQRRTAAATGLAEVTLPVQVTRPRRVAAMLPEAVIPRATRLQEDRSQLLPWHRLQELLHHHPQQRLLHRRQPLPLRPHQQLPHHHLQHTRPRHHQPPKLRPPVVVAAVFPLVAAFNRQTSRLIPTLAWPYPNSHSSLSRIRSLCPTFPIRAHVRATSWRVRRTTRICLL